ncbi:MAG TPA: hypothetical protein VLK29_03175 [Luteimonas sp.]|nr:hypothetical protein [Luteimonas sp.]
MHPSPLQRLLVLATAGLFAVACTPLHARPLVDLTVVDRDAGEWLTGYPHRGEDWIAGTPGHRYGVRLANRSNERVLVVLSVDGVNAVSGQSAHPSQTGYVLEPGQDTQVDGWRKSDEAVAQFVFTDLADSYAARTGRPRDVGVIGIAVFREQPAPRPDWEPAPVAQSRDATAPAPAAAARGSAAEAAQQSLGTGHGDREWAPVSRTGFVRASRTPAQVTQLRYDAVEVLAGLGILPRPGMPPRRQVPRAFPGGYVADPPPRY